MWGFFKSLIEGILGFFRDENSRLDVHRLTFFLSFIVSSIIVMRLAFHDKLMETMFEYWMTVFAATGVSSKMIDNGVFSRKGVIPPMTTPAAQPVSASPAAEPAAHPQQP